MPDHDRQADIRKVAKILRDGNYSYDQSADLFKKARREVGLSPPDRSGQGSPERLSSEEQEAFLNAALATYHFRKYGLKRIRKGFPRLKQCSMKSNPIRK